MSHAVCRVQKIKGSAAITGLQIHNRRERKHSNTNPDIDNEKSKNNYALIQPSHERFNELVDARVKNGYKGVKNVRRDAVRACEVLFTSDNEFFSSLDVKQQRFFFENCLEWARVSRILLSRRRHNALPFP